MFYHVLITNGININCGLAWKASAHLYCFFFFFLSFLGLHPQHVEVPRLGVLIRAVATSLRQSHSHAGSELHL